MARLAAEYAVRERQLERRDRLQALQERVNGELELGRRALREEAEQLALDQQRRHEEPPRPTAQDEARRRAELDAEQRAGARAAG
ncbi:MAG: hypothetical protein U0797_22500 [Gemmataceae bacterium]